MSLPAKHEKSIAAAFKSATESAIGDGESTLFWVDRWLSGQCIRQIAPALFRAVPRSKRSKTVASALPHAWARDITGAPTLQVLVEYLNVWDLVESVVLQPGSADKLIWRWSSDGVYSATSAYRALFLGVLHGQGG